MPQIEKTFIVTSKQHPDKVYTSSEEFWADHDTSATDAANEVYITAGKIISTTSVLNEGGQSVTYSKTYVSEEAWTEYTEGEVDAIAEDETVCTFTKVGSRVSEPA